MYEKLDEVIMEVIKEYLDRNRAGCERYGVDVYAHASAIVGSVQLRYDERYGKWPTKMTVWRHIHKLAKEGKIILEKRPPVTMWIYTIKLPKHS